MASLTLDPAPAAQPSDAGSGVNDGLSTTASGQNMTYCGIPAKGIYRHRQGFDPSHGIDPKQRLEYMLELSWTDEPRGRTEISEAAHLLWNQVWYNQLRWRNLAIAVAVHDSIGRKRASTARPDHY